MIKKIEKLLFSATGLKLIALGLKKLLAIVEAKKAA